MTHHFAPCNRPPSRVTQLFAGLTAGLILLLLGACDKVPPPTVAPAAPLPATARPRIALVMKTLTNPFFIEMEKGARRAEQEEQELDLLVRTAAQETSIEQQIGIVDQLIRDRVAAIVIAP